MIEGSLTPSEGLLWIELFLKVSSKAFESFLATHKRSPVRREYSKNLSTIEGGLKVRK